MVNYHQYKFLKLKVLKYDKFDNSGHKIQLNYKGIGAREFMALKIENIVRTTVGARTRKRYLGKKTPKDIKSTPIIQKMKD